MTLAAYTGVLTLAHRQMITGIRDQWAGTVLSTAPVDRAATLEAVHRLYDTHRLPRPSLTIWMDSPLGCIYAAAVVGQLREQLRGQFVNQLRRYQLQHQLGRPLWRTLAGQIRDQLGDRLGDRLRGLVRGELEDQLSGQLQGRLNSRLWGQLRGQIKGKLHGQLWDQLRGRPWDEFWDQFGGELRIQLGDQHGSQGEDQGRDEIEGRDGAELYSVFPWNDAYAIAFDGCVLPIVGRPADPRLAALSSVVAETGWLIPMPGAVIVGARPAVLHRDARGDLHNPAGLALAYPDGWGFYAWHGRRVPGWVIVSPSIEAITAEENVEVRRCAIESLGWERFIAEAGLVSVTAGESENLAAAQVPDPGNPGQHEGTRSYQRPGRGSRVDGWPWQRRLRANGQAHVKHGHELSICAALPQVNPSEHARDQQDRSATSTEGTGMTTATLGQLIQKYGFDVLDHLDRDLEIPVHAGLQAQGDLFIIPADPNRGSRQSAAVPLDGIPVIEAVGGGHEHRLFAGQPGTAFFTAAGAGRQDIGLLECTEPAYIAHPEHAYTGIAPGTYTLRRQREQADEERFVAD